jgi:hypothetical protein
MWARIFVLIKKEKSFVVRVTYRYLYRKIAPQVLRLTLGAGSIAFKKVH